MKRLTKATDNLTFLCDHLRRETMFDSQRVKDIHDRLAAYEDTGLEPEEIKDVVALCQNYTAAGLDAKFIQACIDIAKSGVPIDHLRELAEADRDGRCVVLPCKVGDTVYWASNFGKAIHHGKITTVKISRFGIDLEMETPANLLFKREAERVFLTLEATEAALKAGDHR